MTRQECDELYHERGLTVWAIINDSQYQCLDEDLGISVTIDWEKDQFKLDYAVPRSVFKLTSGWMSPFSSDIQYPRMIKRFKEVVQLLQLA